jgi:hypothetical protein
MAEGALQEIDLSTVFNDGDSSPSTWTGQPKQRQRFPILEPTGTPQPVPEAPPVVLADWEKIKRAKAISATFDLPFGMAYDGEENFTAALNEQNPSWTSEIGKSVMRSIGSQYISLGHAMEFVGYGKDQADIYRTFGRQLANAYMPSVKVNDVTWQRFITPEWWATTAVEGVTSSLALLPAGIVGAYAGMTTATAMGLGVFGRAVLTGLFGAAVSRPIESAFEAAQTIEEGKQKGLSDAEVQRQAEYVFNQNMKLAGLDAAQIGLAITPMGSILGKVAPAVLAQRVAASTVARTALGLAKFATVGASEGGEEAFQTGVQQVAREGGTILDKLRQFNPEMQDAAVMGAIMGYGLQGAGSVFTALTDRVVSTMQPKLQEEFHAQVQAGLTVGMDEHDATVSALDNITKTPEGQTHVDQVVKEMKDLAEGQTKPTATAEEIQAEVDKYIADQEAVPDIIPQSDVETLVTDDMVNAIASGETSVDQLLGEAPKDIPEQNFIISEDTYQSALASLKERTRGLHAGLDPFVLGDMVKIGAYHIERGIRSFAEWSKIMLERFGESIKPHLQEVWDNATDMVKRGVKSGIETDVLTEQAKTVENPTMPAKDVKGQVRLSTGQKRIVDMIREDVALNAGMKKAEQASRIAYAAGNKDGIASAKADMQEIVIKAKVKAESFGFSQGFKLAEKLTNREITMAFKAKEQERLDTAKTLIKLINESDIPSTMKGKYLDAVAGKMTEKRVNDILDRINSMSDVATKQEIVDDLNDFKSHMGSIDVDYQKRITELLSDINLKKIGPKTRERLQSLMDFAEREGMPSGVSRKMLADIERLQLRQPEDMSVQDLKDLRDMADHLYQMGKLKRKLWTKYNQRMRERAIKDAVASTKNLDAATADNPGMWNATKGMALSAYMEVLSPLRVGDLVDGAKNERGWNYLATRQLSAKSIEAQYNTKARTSAVMEEAERLGFKTMDISDENLGRIVANIRILEGSPRAAETIMEKFGWTTLEPLTQQETRLVDAMEKATNERVNEVAALWEERHNTPFVKRDRYILPLYYEGDFSTGIDDSAKLSDPYRTVSVPQGFGIERVEGVTKQPRIDLWGMLEQAISEQEWFLEVQPEIDNIKRVVKSKDYVNHAGQSVSNWWANHLDIVARKGITTSAAAARRSMPWVHKFLGKARDNMSTAVLGFRASSILIQPLAVFNTLAYISSEFGPAAAGEVLSEFAKTWVSTSHFKAIVDASHALQMRAAGEVALAELLQDTQANTRMNKFKRASMALLQKADLRTTAGTQQAIENILNKQGVPNAHLEAETITHLVAAASDVAVRPHVFSRGEVAKTFLTFQTFMVNSFGMFSHDMVKRGVLNPSYKKKMAALIGIGFYLAGKAAENEVRELIYQITNRKDKPEDRWPSWIKAVFGIASDIPFFGNVFNIVSAHGGSSEVPIQKMLNDTIRESIGALGAIAKEPKPVKGRRALGATDDTAKQIGQAVFQTGKTVATIGTGVPGVGQGLDVIEGLMFPEKGKKK